MSNVNSVKCQQCQMSTMSNVNNVKSAQICWDSSRSVEIWPDQSRSHEICLIMSKCQPNCQNDKIFSARTPFENEIVWTNKNCISCISSIIVSQSPAERWAETSLHSWAAGMEGFSMGKKEENRLRQKCFDLCKTLAGSERSFAFSLKIGEVFAISLVGSDYKTHAGERHLISGDKKSVGQLFWTRRASLSLICKV